MHAHRTFALHWSFNALSFGSVSQLISADLDKYLPSIRQLHNMLLYAADRVRLPIVVHGLQGLIALLSNSAFMLALHVILGAMLGAALAAHIEGVFNQQEMRYDMTRALMCMCPTRECNSRDWQVVSTPLFEGARRLRQSQAAHKICLTA